MVALLGGVFLLSEVSLYMWFEYQAFYEQFLEFSRNKQAFFGKFLNFLRNKQAFFGKFLNLLRNKQAFFRQFLVSLRKKQAFSETPHVMSEVPLCQQLRGPYGRHRRSSPEQESRPTSRCCSSLHSTGLEQRGVWVSGC